MQNFKPIKANDFMSRSREVINSNFDCIASDFSGNSFPTSNLIPNMSCFRTDQKKLYRLNPDMRTWRLAIDFSGDKVTIENAHQSENALKSDALKAEHVVSIDLDESKTGLKVIFEQDGKVSSKELFFELMKSTLLDFCYPIGHLWVSQNSTDPANIVGGTWEAVPEGTTIVAAGKKYKAGATGGEATHTILESEMPKHSHKVTLKAAGNHSHTRGTMEISGTFPNGNERNNFTPTGAFYKTPETATTAWDGTSRPNVIGFQASRNWTGATSVNGEHNHELTVGSTGSNQAMNNMPPYKVWYMWQRIK